MKYYYLDYTIVKKSQTHVDRNIYLLLCVKKDSLQDYLDMQKWCAENDIKLAGGSVNEPPKAGEYYYFSYLDSDVANKIKKTVKELELEKLAEEI